MKERYNGNLEVVDVTGTGNSIFFSNESGVDYRFQVILHDAAHGYLYTCGVNLDTSTIGVYQSFHPYSFHHNNCC